MRAVTFALTYRANAWRSCTNQDVVDISLLFSQWNLSLGDAGYNPAAT
jgi:hypothetical protein